MLSSQPHVRPATERDVPAAVDTLTHAFADYPFTSYAYGRSGRADGVRRSQELLLTHVGMAYGRVWVTDDCRAVAVWTTPERDAGPGFAEMGPALAELAGDRRAALETAGELLGQHRPSEPCWFLSTVGVDPSAQGKGLGRAVILPGLWAADQAGQPAYLETATEWNVRFYERLGFSVSAEVDLPDSGPRTWCMWRGAGA